MEVVFYQKEDGTRPVEDFVESLEEDEQVKVMRTISLLKVKGTSLREPYSKKLQDGIMELRTAFRGNISRVLYFFVAGNKAVLTNGFVKKSQKTPPNEIERAIRYRKDWQRREQR